MRTTMKIATGVMGGKKAGFTLPYSVDFSALADGDFPSDFTGDTWTISSSGAINTPALGVTELLTNPTFDTHDGTADDGITEGFNGWGITLGTGGVVDATVTDAYDDVGAKLTSAANSRPNLYQTKSSQTAGTWYLLSMYVKGDGTEGIRGGLTSAYPECAYQNITNAYVEVVNTGFITGTSVKPDIFNAVAAHTTCLDNCSLRTITKSNLFAFLPDSKVASVTLQAVITVLGGGTQAGFVMNVDDAATPLNYVMAYVSGNSGNYIVSLDKCVNGTYTPKVITGTAIFGATKNLKVIKDGDNYSLYYGTVGAEAQIGVTTEITGFSGTIHGLFSTYSGNKIKNFSVAATNPM